MSRIVFALAGALALVACDKDPAPPSPPPGDDGYRAAELFGDYFHADPAVCAGGCVAALTPLHRSDAVCTDSEGAGCPIHAFDYSKSGIPEGAFDRIDRVFSQGGLIVRGTVTAEAGPEGPLRTLHVSEVWTANAQADLPDRAAISRVIAPPQDCAIGDCDYAVSRVGAPDGRKPVTELAWDTSIGDAAVERALGMAETEDGVLVAARHYRAEDGLPGLEIHAFWTRVPGN
jgi:hypothetical protein